MSNLITLNNLINTNSLDMLGEGIECGKVGCREFAHKETEYCFSHQPKCLDCNDTGICEKDEWVGTDTNYQVEVRCECNK